ncbi:IS110 family RNA-guided transposase [Nonlabens ponticola]|uniref:IS110 family transposase n=1 Tax=Nonlabens ponticola TaxID=2496866 RepID=A0A3S9MX37_9FLAO|nr:IS110 family transposase [Nonlabens ponticola]AZQ43795.1 IS110 family transposase [Nonlabens ponticola]
MTDLIIGIDISAQTLDICIREQRCDQFFVIKNKVGAIKKFLVPLVSKDRNILLGMENTGRYNYNLYEVLRTLELKTFVIYPFHLKKSLGLVRGKNDKVDAERIANFVEKNHKELDPWKPCSETIMEMKYVMTERRSKIKTRARLLQQQRDLKLIKDPRLKRRLVNMFNKSLKLVSQQIKDLEAILEELIDMDQTIREQIELVRSVPGVGTVLSTAIVIKTEGFNTYTDPRKLACSAGVVPFNYQSGISLKSRNRVSHMADKSMKTLLHMAAMRAVRLECDLKYYYQRKIAEGKNKMSVLNAVRNKIIHIIYALIKNQTIYKNSLSLS